MPNLVIIGHRGAPSLAPENTLPSFNRAAQLGAQIELDVHLSKDGHVVVIHDETLERTTNGKGLVANHSLLQLKRLDAGSWYNSKFINTTIPTLDEVLAALPEKISINVELKTDILHYPGIERKVIEIIRKFKAQSRVIISSFNWDSLATMYRLEPKLKLGLLFDSLKADLWSKARLLNAYSIHPFTELATPHLIWQAHSWGYRVFPWVVNNRTNVLELNSMGVDGVFTDCPQIFTRFGEY